MSSLWRIGLDILRVSAPALIAVAYIRYHPTDGRIVSNWRMVTYVCELTLVSVPIFVISDQLPYLSREVYSLRRQFYDFINRLRGIQLPRIPFIVRLRIRQVYCCILIPCYLLLLHTCIYHSFNDINISAQLFCWLFPASIYVNERALLAFQRIPEIFRALIMLTGVVTSIAGTVCAFYYRSERYSLTVLIGMDICIIGYRYVLERTFDNRFQLLNGNAFDIRNEQVENEPAPAPVIREAAEVNELPLERELRAEIAIEAADNNELAENLNFQQIQNEENLEQGEDDIGVIAADGNELLENINFEKMENVKEKDAPQDENDFVLVDADDNQLAEFGVQEVQSVPEGKASHDDNVNIIAAENAEKHDHDSDEAGIVVEEKFPSIE